jgi:hypothetical protein
MLSAARAIGDEWRRAKALSAVAKCLPPEATELLSEVLLEARAISDEDGRVEIWSAVADHVPQAVTELLAETLQAVSAGNWRIGVVAAPIIIRSLLLAARRVINKPVHVVRALGVKLHRIFAVSAVAERVPPNANKSHQEILRIDYSTIRASSIRRREDLLEVIQALLPVIHRLGGEKAVRETAQAIIDTAKWWP